MVPLSKALGAGVTAFGAGILIAFFLPDTALIILEAGVIVSAGILFSRA